MIDTIGEVLIALMAAGGLVLLGWLMFGRLLVPTSRNSPVYAVIPVSGSGEELEQTVNALLWLKNGNLARFTIVLADTGLDDDGRAVVRTLLRREPDLILCPMDGLERCIKETTRYGTIL